MSVTTVTLLNMENLTRRNIRYICFRIQIEEVEGRSSKGDGILTFVSEVKAHMEGQDMFNGWAKFGQTWDVDEKAPLVVVSRTSSLHSDWNKVVERNAKDIVQVKTKTGTKRAKVADASHIDGK